MFFIDIFEKIGVYTDILDYSMQYLWKKNVSLPN